MSIPQHQGGRSAVASGPLVVKRRRTGLVAGVCVSLGVALAAFVGGLIATRGDHGTAASLLGFLAGVGVMSCIVFGVLAGRAGAPLLVVDDFGVSTGRAPKVRLSWSQLERVRIFQDSGSAAIGIFPASVDQVATRLFGETAQAQTYAERLRYLAETQGAPIVIRLANTSTEPAAAVAAITSLAAGRTAVTG